MAATSFLSGHHLDKGRKPMVALVGLAALLSVTAVVGMAYVAGFDKVEHRLDSAEWWWLGPSFAAVVVSFAGYCFAYRAIKVAEGGPRIETSTLLAVVIAGFGGFLAHGGTALDEYAMRAGGENQREANVRVGALTGFELGGLALIVCPASIVALILGVVIPRTDFTWPWAVIPPIGFVVAFWLSERYRDRLRERDGWRGKLGFGFDVIHVVFAVFKNPRRYGIAVLGILLYWGADMFALWSATAAFGFQMTALAVIVAVGTGMFFTRRTAPLGGAGILMVALVPTLWYGAAVPFAAATLGVAAYRFLTLWVPLPAAFAALPRLRALARRDDSGGEKRATKREPALQH